MNVRRQQPSMDRVDPHKTNPLEYGRIVEGKPPGLVHCMRTEQDPTPATCAQLHCAREVAADLTVSRQIEFLAFVAHELRNPLAPIRTAAALLTRANAKELERAQHVIERQVTHLGRMVEDLLDMARGHMGKLRLAIETVELEDCIELAAAACHPAMERRHQRLEIRGLGQGCPMQADPVRVTQILSNLLDNASKYSPEGVVVHLEVRRLAETVEMTVIDAGIGIAAAALSTVFEPFAQTAQAVVFNASGLGIGLAVVRELAQSHGGRVTAFSEGVGRGSRFVVTLPVVQGAHLADA
jgi:signal transduction histidine kinase